MAGAGAPRNPNLFDEFLHLRWRRGCEPRDSSSDDEVDDHPQGSNPLRRYAEPPVVHAVELRVQELEIEDVAKREADAGNAASAEYQRPVEE